MTFPPKMDIMYDTVGWGVGGKPGFIKALGSLSMRLYSFTVYYVRVCLRQCKGDLRIEA